ncbi:M23 family metallopeptidase [Microbacterium sp. NRRL B-14842]|uniref:M23 family metallopeptidase n=1 Tax=Microbacterium sp. NRRL B-14842 TaxID=3162881 RepID=UPI003D2BA581
MKRTSRLRLGRIGIVAVLAIVLGSLVPALTTTGSAVAASDGYMVYPASGNIQSKVGDGCLGNYRAHDGIDISRNGGTPILAAYDGVIKSRTSNGGYGNYVDVQHPGGYVTRYAHMAASGWYAPGTKVLRGQQIGVVGNTGNSAALPPALRGVAERQGLLPDQPGFHLPVERHARWDDPAVLPRSRSQRFGGDRYR